MPESLAVAGSFAGTYVGPVGFRRFVLRLTISVVAENLMTFKESRFYRKKTANPIQSNCSYALGIVFLRFA